jgi:hypothetical protein
MLVFSSDQPYFTSSDSPNGSDAVGDAASTSNKTMTDSLANFDRSGSYRRSYSRERLQRAGMPTRSSDELGCEQEPNSNASLLPVLGGVDWYEQLGTFERLDAEEIN